MDYAVLDAEGNCINRIVWDGNPGWQPPEGCTAVPDPDGNYSVPNVVLEVVEPEDPLESLSYDQKQALVALLNNQ